MSEAARKVILVTGGSRGIGRATALACARAGYAVAVNYVSAADAAAAVVGEIEAGGGTAIAVAGDVARESDVLAMFEAAAALGPLGGLVNNAGIVVPAGRLETRATADLKRLIDVNVLGSILCAREAVRRLSTRNSGPGGSIVNLSSAAARTGGPGEWVDYAASKGAIDSFTNGLAREVAAEGIRVNAVRPGLIDTEIHAAGGEPGRVARLRSAIPMQREGSSAEVAEAIVWLLSDAASYVTGALLDVTGGR